MATMTTTPVDRFQEVHTEVRSPIEVVLERIVYFVFGVIEALLAIRFVFSLFGANQQAPFSRFIYNVTSVFMVPFNAIFNTQRAGGATFEWDVLVAIAVYALLAWAIVALIRAVSPRERAGTVERVERDDYLHTT